MSAADNTTSELPPNPPGGGNIQPITIEEEMQRSYLDYAMSVIVSRALPDVRDGLKPVHRRILFAMHQGGYDSSKPFKKSARIVGDVMGKFHPHGDSAIYDAMVRLTQDFSMRLPQIDGQGNFGSLDDDPAAAMRYTEARLAKAAEINLDDIDKDTVDFQDNYDGNDQEPKVLPARYPNLLVNGANGIAVGMATNIPPHNLGEVIDACCALLDDPTLGNDQLMAYVPAPDFPTGAIILGRSGAYGLYHNGQGSIKMRGRTHFEEIRKDKTAIIIDDIPYQLSKKRLIERIAEVVNEKIVEGITEIRDESDQSGVRVVIELRRDAQPDVVLNNLYKHTPLQTSFGANLLALHRGRPQRLNLQQCLVAFLEFREEVIIRRTKYELMKARERAHILVGLMIAVANIDAIIALIRQAPDPQTAKEQLMSTPWDAESVLPLLNRINGMANANDNGKVYHLSDIQAKAILELRLQRLTALERDKITDELNEVANAIQRYLEILNDRTELLGVMRTELLEVKEKFATPRRTEIIESEAEEDIEDLIPREDMVVTVSHAGYIKRVPLATYRAQKRGGKGRGGMDLKDDDAVIDLYVANTHTQLLCFTTKGIVHSLKVYKLPLGNPQARGKALINLLPLAQDEKISVILPMPDISADATAGEQDKYNIMFATSHGTVRRNNLSDFSNIRSNGLIAMKLGEGEKLISVKIATNDQDVLLVSKQGKAIRFGLDELRVFAGRTSTGVRAIKLTKDDEVMSMSVLEGTTASMDERDTYLKLASTCRRLQTDENGNPQDVTYAMVCKEAEVSDFPEERFNALQKAEQFLLTITDRGFGKRSSSYEYRQSGRGGQGITAMALTDKTGQMVAAYPITPDEQIMMVSDQGQIIRMPVHDIRIAGRNTQGVTLFRVAGDEQVVSVATLREEKDENGEAATEE
ncbi:MAG TPA: DNA gyrase subunit A [Alphaproteobacteria bacterium]